MAIKIRFDSDLSIASPTIILAYRSGKFIRELPAYQISFKDNLNNGSDFTFKVNKDDCLNIDGSVDKEFWNKISDFKLIYCKEFKRWYEIAVEVEESNSVLKTITAKSLGKAELSQILLYNLDVNTEDDIDREDYEPTVFYDPENKETSLLDRMLDKAPHYSVGHVDDSLKNIQRTFSFSKKSIDDAFTEVSTEIGCLFDYECTCVENDKGLRRVINVYDLQSVCLDCGERGNYTAVCDHCGSTNIKHGYGEDTSIYVSAENLADDITYKTETGQVKNCFRLEAGDDIMTAAVVSCNPNGSAYLWYISDATKQDMSPELVERIDSYNERYSYYQDEYVFEPDSDLKTAYNALVTKYKSYKADIDLIGDDATGFPALMELYYTTIDFHVFLSDGLLPSVSPQAATAQTEAAKLSNRLVTVAVSDVEKCTQTTASSAVLAFAKSIIDKRFSVSIESGTYTSSAAGQQWIGVLRVKNDYDDDDTADANVFATITDDYVAQAKQKIDIVLDGGQQEDIDVASLFELEQDEFETSLANYGLSSLNSLHDICSSIIDILIGQGVSDESNVSSAELYDDLYSGYYAKLGAIEGEISLRESEIKIIDDIQAEIVSARSDIQEELNFESYIGDPLWTEFSSFRRESVYENKNYISDGLSTDEIFSYAEEFLEEARKEIYSSAEEQHVIAASLKNLLAMKEFAPIVDQFAVGNWIRLSVDEKIYRVRLLEYEIDYDSPMNTQVTFSDVRTGYGTIDDLKSILDQAKSMASMFDAVIHQAEKGNKGAAYVFDWLKSGLDLTNTKIVSTANNQDVVYNKNGLVAREYDPLISTYGDQQVKMINRGVYFTKDNWKTVETGIGEFIYLNPETGKYEADYGVIAKKLVASLLLSENVKVYNSNSSIDMGEDGIIITTDGEANNENGVAFTIRRRVTLENGNITYEPILSVNNMGRLSLDGSVNIVTSSGSTSELATWLDQLNTLDSRQKSNYNEVINAITSLQTTSNGLSIRVSQIEDAENTDAYVVKSTGYVFGPDGLNISKLGEEIDNTIDNTGVYVMRGNDRVLVANNEGVEAINVTARQYLTIGPHARFEPFDDGSDSARTACFFVDY